MSIRHPTSSLLILPYLLYFPPSLSLRASSWRKSQSVLQTPQLFEAERLSPPPLGACHRQDWQLVMKYEQVISRHPSVCESPKTPWCGGGTDVREDLLQLVTCPLPQAASSASQHSLPQPPASERFFFTELWTCGPTLYWLAAAYGTSSTSGITRNTRRTRDEHDEWNTNPFN